MEIAQLLASIAVLLVAPQSTGTQSGEDLFRRLASPDEEERRTTALYLAKILPPESTLLLASPDRAVRLRAIEAARMFTIHQDRLVPALVPFLNSSDGDERAWCAWSLGGLTPASLPALVDALTHDDAQVRIAAAEGIEKSMWPFWNDSLRSNVHTFPPWRRRAPSRHPQVESWHILCSEHVGAISRSLSDPAEEVRVFAAMSLWKLGIEAKSAQRALESAGHDRSAAVRFWARHALERTKDSPRALLMRLASHWDKNKEKWGRSDRDSTIDASIRDLHSPEAWSRDNWGRTFWPVDTDRRWVATRRLIRSWLPCLVALESSPNVLLSTNARALLAWMEHNAQARITWLLGAMDSEVGPGPAARELIELGPAVIPSVTWDFLRCPRFPIGLISHECLAHVLVALGDDGLATLAMGLEQWREEPRAWGAQGLVKAGRNALPALPAIVSAWRSIGDYNRPAGSDPFWDVPCEQHFATGFFMLPESLGPTHARALASLGPAALPALITALEDRHASVRRRAAHAMQGFGSSASSALDALSRRLSDPDPSARGAAAYAIVLIAPPESPVRHRAQRVVDESQAK
jgi:HEAT repeat protein